MSRIDAEQSVLGGLMLNPDAFWRVSGVVAECDFTRRDHAFIFRAIRECLKAQLPIDPVTLGDWFEERGKSGMVEGGAYLVELASTTPSAANVVAYAEIVAKHAEGRRVQEAGQQIARCESYTEAQTLLAAVRPQQQQRVKSVRDGLGEMLDAMQERANGVCGLSWGVPALDGIAGRLVGSRLYGIAARAKMGKTTLALAPQIRAALAGQRVLCFSLEMTAGELIQRAVCNVGHVSHSLFEREEGVPDEAWSKIHAAAAKLHDAPWLIDDQPALTPEQIISRSKQHHMEEPLSLIVVDHIGLIRLPKKANRNDELGEVTYSLKNLSKELGVPVVAVCQLNRNLESRADRRPIMSDLRDSGNIEQDMDCIVAVYRDEVYHESSTDAGHAEIFTLANRHGRGGTVFASADLEHMTYGEPRKPRTCFPVGSHSANSSGGGFKSYGKARVEPRQFPRTGSDG